jgi:molybdopterin synthase sulfur carrier subunit
MKIDLLFFGITKDIAGQKQLELELPDKTTVSGFKNVLLERYPGFSGLNALAIAVNNEYADDSILIKHGDEVALIPPVSGG